MPVGMAQWMAVGRRHLACAAARRRRMAATGPVLR